jgi:hypothetical protein
LGSLSLTWRMVQSSSKQFVSRLALCMVDLIIVK